MSRQTSRMNRRTFLRATGGLGLAAGTGGLLDVVTDAYAFGSEANLSETEARFYKKLDDREIECSLCPRECRLGDKERGYCGVRENRGGTYYTLVYGKACAIHVDPIEKKPFFHFLPNSKALSIAAAGCNVNCKFCQNWEISQVRPEQIDHVDLNPKQAVSSALKYECPVIAYTYTEPVVYFEYMYDTAIEARKKRVKNVVITGGHVNKDPLLELIKVVDAIKVDLKAFNQDFYTKYVRGELKPVLEAVEIIADSPVWLEIVYLVIPNLNDTQEEIRMLSRWLISSVGPHVPLHLSRFHPMYLMKNLPPTPVSTLETLRKVALDEGLHYVYLGNVPGHLGENTYCPRCGNKIIPRIGYQVQGVELNKGNCKFCKNPIAGVWT
ncbi:AmmeMemoRadiSam system radical SAM enzyme [Acidobacteriota bacterium]